MKKRILILMIVGIFMMCFSLNAWAETLPSNKWNLYFENIQISEGSVTAINPPQIKGSSNSEIDFDVKLNTPGEFYEFTVNVVNAGTMDAMVSEISDSQLNDNQKRYLSYEVTYLNGNKVQKNDLLKAGTTQRIKIRIEFKKDINPEDLPIEDTSITLVLNTCYVQADDDANEPGADDPSENPNENGNNGENSGENGNSSSNGNESSNGSSNGNSGESGNANGSSTNGSSDANGSNGSKGTNGDSQNNTGNGKKSGSLSNSVKTGDVILQYAVIGFLAIIALVFTIYKAKKIEKIDKNEQK